MQKATLETCADSAVDVPLYTSCEAARYLHLSSRCIDNSAGPQRDHDGISFRQLAEMFVRASTFQVLNELGPIAEPSHISSLCERFVQNFRRGTLFPVSFDDTPLDQKIENLVDRYSLVDERDLLRKWFALSLGRVEVVDAVPVRIYPFTRNPADGSPRIVVLDPLVRFGCPMIAGKGITTEIVFGRHQAGDSIAELADDYGLAISEVEEALRYESLPSFTQSPVFGL